MDKLDKLDISIKETGEAITKEDYESIQKEERANLIKFLCWKIENEPYKMTLEELETYRLLVKRKKKNSLIKYKLEAGNFVSVMRQDKELIKKLDSETKALLYEISMIINKSGIILYGNNKPIPSFEKLKEYVGIGHSRWTKIKSDIDEFDIIIKRKDKNNRNVLIVNPFFAIISTEVTEIRFITFGNFFKDKLYFEDYLFLCKKHDIVPEY